MYCEEEVDLFVVVVPFVVDDVVLVEGCWSVVLYDIETDNIGVMESSRSLGMPDL